MVNFTLYVYDACFPFDSKGFVKNNLELGLDYYHFPTMEDFWEDCEDDFELRRRDWMRL